MLILSSNTSGAMYLKHTHTPRQTVQTQTSSVQSGAIWLTFVTDCLYMRLPLGAHALVRGDVDGICDGLVAYCEAQISDGTREILLYQDVLRFQVTVRDTRFT